MNTFDRILGLSIVGLFLTSCLTTQSVTIDQMEPGKVPLPPQIRKVALISRNFKFSIDTLGNYWNLNFRLTRGNKEDNHKLDSLGVTKSLEELRKTLLESGRFDEVFVYPYNSIKPHIGVKELPLSSSFIQSLCTESETDAVISLEMLSFFYSRHNGTSSHEIRGGANAKVTAIWSVYTPKKEGFVDRFTQSEVIRWSEQIEQQNKQKNILPGRSEAISLACRIAAKNYSKRIVPYWTESTRILLGLDNPEFTRAIALAHNNKWKAASSIWEKYAKGTRPRIAGIAALDYAIAQEMLGDFEKALVWSSRSVQLLKSGEAGRIARGYAAILYERKLKAASLNTLLKSNQP